MQQSKDEIRLAADIQTDSIVDGPGLRAVVWTQGCSHNCPGCQNPQTHSFTGGGLVSLNLVYDEIDRLENQDGITISGGDPMFQPYQCYKIAEYAKKKGLNVWVYTGFTYDEVLKMSKKDDSYMKFLKNIDVLVDGKFIIAKKNLGLLFRGSENQRLIKVQESLQENKIILLDEDEYNENHFFQKDKMFI